MGGWVGGEVGTRSRMYLEVGRCGYMGKLLFYLSGVSAVSLDTASTDDCQRPLLYITSSVNTVSQVYGLYDQQRKPLKIKRETVAVMNIIRWS